MIALDTALVPRGDSTRDLWAAAAVRESFRTGDLLAGWLGAHADAGVEVQESAMRTAMAIQDVAKPALASDGSDALRLPAEVRMRALGELGADAAKRALGRVPAADLTMVETYLGQLLAGADVAVDPSDREQLAALRQAAGCSAAAGVTPPVSEAMVASHIQWLDLMLSLGGPDLHRFVGRKNDIARLHALWESRTHGVAITGPGGMGKSLLVSRFVAELIEGDSEHRPVAVFHIDYDRRDLQNFGKSRASSLEVLTNELVRQARRWLPPAAIDHLLGSGVNRGPWALESQSFSRASSQHSARGNVIIELAAMFRDRAPHPRMVLVFDSMEQILGFDDEAVHGIEYISQRLQDGGVVPFSICISRSFASDTRLVEWQGGQLIDLAQFTEEEARIYIGNESARAQVDLDEPVVDRVLATVGRSPLALRLAISLIDKDRSAFDARQWAKSLRDDPERIQASLYDRILKRVRDPNLARIARPGLLVRRLSVEVIERVLAAPCGLALVPGDANRLLERGRGEGQLFVANSDDPESRALWHRADVRALMLPDLDATVSDAVSREINQRAVDYYTARTDPISRVEELYHRLRLGQDAVELDRRWNNTAGVSLRTVLDELPPESRRYVRRRLGSASVAAIADVGPGTNASDDELREVVRRELQSVADGADPMATLSHFGADEMSGPLADLYAEALLAKGRINDLLAGAAKLAETPNAPRFVRAAVSCIAGGALEGLGHLSEAFDYWRRAVDLAALDDEDALHQAIAARIGAIRTARKQDEIRHFAGFERIRAADIAETLDLVERVLASLSRRAVEAREVVAELSDPTAQAPVPPMLFRTLANLIEGGEAFPSLIEDQQRLPSIAARFKFSAGTPRELSNYLSKMIFDREAGRVIELMREEVDWTLERACRPTTSADVINVA